MPCLKVVLIGASSEVALAQLVITENVPGTPSLVPRPVISLKDFVNQSLSEADAVLVYLDDVN